MINFDGGADSMTDWYTRISDNECRALVAAEGRPDLGPLALGARPALRIDERASVRSAVSQSTPGRDLERRRAT
jgi:hypothetical protein